MERWTKSLQLQRLILDRGKSKRKTIAKTDYLTDIFILPRESKQICQPKTILVIGKMQESKKRKKKEYPIFSRYNYKLEKKFLVTDTFLTSRNGNNK